MFSQQQHDLVQIEKDYVEVRERHADEPSDADDYAELPLISKRNQIELMKVSHWMAMLRTWMVARGSVLKIQSESN